MNLRVRLIVVFFLLSVVPVGAVTYYTYASNAQAIRDAARGEAEQLAAELSDRMRLTTAQLSQRVELLMDLPEPPQATKIATAVPRPTPAPAPPPAPAAPQPPTPEQAIQQAAELAARAAAQHPSAAELDRALGDLAVMIDNIEVRGLRPRRLGPRPDGIAAGTPPSPDGGAVVQPGGPRPPEGPQPPDGLRSRLARPGTPGADAGARRGGAPGDIAAEPADPTRVQIDLRGIRRELFEELVPDRAAFDKMPPEERQKVFAQIEQRMQGVAQGIAVLKKELASRTRDARVTVAPAAPAETPAADAASPTASTAPVAPTAPAPPPPATASAPAPAATASPSPSASAVPRPSRPRATTTTIGPAAAATTPAASAAAAPAAAAGMKRSTSLSGRRLNVRVERGGEVVGQVNADVDLPRLLSTVFEATPRNRGELPFAVGEGGEIFTASPADKQRLEALRTSAVTSGVAAGTTVLDDWIVATTADPTGSRLKFGIARPVGEALRELEATSARNAGLGLAFIGLALVVIVPLSGRLTRNLDALSAGVHRIASGDYSARVPVRSHDEVGRLAVAFNQMAADVEAHQRDAVNQERLRRELELGRQIQHDMLPRSPLQLGLTEIKGVSVPAREVGGDFFNYFALRDGTIALLVGDVSGKGVGAALLMANLQAALRTRLSLGQDLAALAQELDVDIDRTTPGPVYATLFVGILDPIVRQLRFVNAGHNPQYVLRMDGRLDRMESTGRPIGLLSGGPYAESRIDLDAGDVLFFYTDGCVEAENAAGDMFGAERLEHLLAASAGRGAEQVMVAVESEVSRFRSGAEPTDDATIMVVKVG